jgi:hypothetical protein
VEQVGVALQALVADINDRELYPREGTPPSQVRIAGSAVLQRLFREWAKCDYDKVVDGPRLAHHVQRIAPERLEPLMMPIKSLLRTESAPDR